MELCWHWKVITLVGVWGGSRTAQKCLQHWENCCLPAGFSQPFGAAYKAVQHQACQSRVLSLPGQHWRTHEPTWHSSPILSDYLLRTILETQRASGHSVADGFTAGPKAVLTIEQDRKYTACTWAWFLVVLAVWILEVLTLADSCSRWHHFPKRCSHLQGKAEPSDPTESYSLLYGGTTIKNSNRVYETDLVWLT